MDRKKLSFSQKFRVVDLPHRQPTSPPPPPPEPYPPTQDQKKEKQ